MVDGVDLGACRATPGQGGGAARLARMLCEPVDAASLNAFRFAFGILLLTEFARFIAYDWIAQHYLRPRFLFKYEGFHWVAAWPGDGLYWHFAAMALLSAMVAIGWLYRIAIVALTLAFGYVFLLDQASYLNQYYLLLSVAFVLCLVPAHRGCSVDAWRRRGALPQQVPRWAVVAPCLLFELVLLHAGLVKINDDWLHGQPLGLWLAEVTQTPLLRAWLSHPGVALAASYAIILLHLVGAPLLFFRRTRLPVFLVYVVFHLANSLWLQIGVFPWITLAGTLLFFPPDWPRRVWRRLSSDDPRATGQPAATSAFAPARAIAPAPAAFPMPVGTMSVLAGFLLFQLLFPLRHVLAHGNVAWTGESEFFSWRMKLDDKRASAHFRVRDPATGRQWDVDPHTHLQARQVAFMAARPALILQFAHYLSASWAIREGVSNAEVRAHVVCALNGRPPAVLIDPDRDLARIRDPWWNQDWILPLNARLAAAANTKFAP